MLSNAFQKAMRLGLRMKHVDDVIARFTFDDGIERVADLLIDERFWIETDHYAHHAGAGPQKATDDLQRERAIRNAGFEFARYLDWEFTHDRPAIEADIRAKLGL
jgi:hypothetical protein